MKKEREKEKGEMLMNFCHRFIWQGQLEKCKLESLEVQTTVMNEMDNFINWDVS